MYHDTDTYWYWDFYYIKFLDFTWYSFWDLGNVINDTDTETWNSFLLILILIPRLEILSYRYWYWYWDFRILLNDTDTETIPESIMILILILRLLLHRAMKFQLRLKLRLCNLKNRYWDWDLGMWKIDTDTETETQGCEKPIPILRLRPASLKISRRYR